MPESGQIWDQTEVIINHTTSAHRPPPPPPPPPPRALFWPGKFIYFLLKTSPNVCLPELS